MELNVDPDAGGERGALTHTEVSAAARLKKLERRVSAIENTPIPTPAAAVTVRLRCLEDTADKLQADLDLAFMLIMTACLAVALLLRRAGA